MNPYYVVRPAVPDDAAGLSDLVRSVATEPYNGILHISGDVFRTVEEERKVIEQRMAAENTMILVAEANGQIIARVSCVGGVLASTQHTVGLGIMVRKEWRGQGVGTTLMHQIIDWARANPIVKRVDLEVLTNNPRAANLYEKLGFQAEGIKRQIYFKDGVFVDAQMMALVFERKVIPTL
jgi:RimJ/RimL family protein N-acetyltransferase